MNTAFNLAQNKAELTVTKSFAQRFQKWLEKLTIPGAEHMSKTK